MRVVYFGTYRTEYSRNKILIAGLRASGIDVMECHEALWYGIDDRIQAVRGGWKSLSFIKRIVCVYCKLLWRGLLLPKYEILICGYPGQFDVFIARLLTWLRQRPLVWDVFMSLYLIAIERQLEKQNPRTINALKNIENIALRLPDLLIQDTIEYVKWLSDTYNLSLGRFRLVPTGADDRIFKPIFFKNNSKDDSFTILYYGSFIPNHNIPYVIEAAKFLNDYTIYQFKLIGEGPDFLFCMELAQSNNLTNVTFLPWMSQEKLINEIYQADLCLGAFGHTPQSLMTVQNKIFEALASAKPIVTGDSPAVRSVLRHKFTAWLCNRNDPQSLAQAIQTLHDNPILRKQLSQEGYSLFVDNYSIKKLGIIFRKHLEEIL